MECNGSLECSLFKKDSSFSIKKNNPKIIRLNVLFEV